MPVTITHIILTKMSEGGGGGAYRTLNVLQPLFYILYIYIPFKEQ